MKNPLKLGKCSRCGTTLYWNTASNKWVHLADNRRACPTNLEEPTSAYL